MMKQIKLQDVDNDSDLEEGETSEDEEDGSDLFGNIVAANTHNT